MTDTDFEMAPCLREGLLADAGQRIVTATRELGPTMSAALIRAWCVVHVFRQRESIFASKQEPANALLRVLEGTTEMLRQMSTSGFAELGARVDASSVKSGELASVEAVTGEYYGILFKDFSQQSFWEEPLRLLRARLDRNGIDTAAFRGKSLLDAGCGGGRYTVAWHALGALPAVGIDISSVNVADAQRRVDQAGLQEIRFEVGDVLNLPVEDNSFDIAFSNGVLLLTRDWKKGVSELLRALKPGGFGWVYLIEEPGGLFWDLIEILRVVMRDEKRETAKLALQILGLPANRVFYMLDHVMAPINVRLTADEIEQCLKQTGATGIRRLNRGADFDRIERIYQGDPFAEVKYGVGEHRYVFFKG